MDKEELIRQVTMIREGFRGHFKYGSNDERIADKAIGTVLRYMTMGVNPYDTNAKSE